METASKEKGIQLLLVAEQEAQKIVSSARSGGCCVSVGYLTVLW